MEASALYQPPSVGEMLVGALKSDPARPGLTLEDGTTITLGEMAEQLRLYLAVLAHLGLGRGKRVGMLSRNRPEVANMTNALAIANVAMVPLHPFGSIEDFAYAIEDTSVDMLVFDPRYYDELVGELAARFPAVRFASFGPSASGLDLLALMATLEPLPLEVAEMDQEDIHRIVMTGGTTGKPKAILLSQRTMTSMLTIQLAEWDWPTEVRTLICAPLSHSGVAMLVPTFLRGGSVVVMDGFEPEKFMAAVQKYRITCTLLVPTMIYALLDHPRFGDYDLSSLESIYYGASSINPERLAEAIRRMGPVFYQFFGQSEAPMTVTVMRRHEHDVDNPLRLASCGRPVPWVRVKLLDDDNREVPAGSPGEICCQGPLVMSGYIGKPDQTEAAFAGGWLHTGDVAVQDADGFLRIIDRKKDMIITGGFNVYPREVEDVLGEHPAVGQVSVVGIPDPKWGEKVAALVVLRKGMEAAAEELIALVRERKGPVQAPKIVAFADAIPLSGLGKPDKKAVRVLMQEMQVGA